MVGFPLPNKIKEFFSKRIAHTGTNRQEVLSSQVLIDKQLYYVRIKTTPFNATSQRNQPGVKLLGRNGAVVLYQIDRQAYLGRDGANYEMVLEVRPFALELTLILSDNQAMAEKHFNGPAMDIVNRFVPYFVENGKNKVFQNVVDLLECIGQNPSFTMTHFAAYFSWNNFFKEGLSIEEAEDTSNPDHWSPLHVAVLCSNEYIVESLLATGMDVYIVDARLWTVMHYAVYSNSKQMVGLLVSMPAFYEQLRHFDENGCTPMHIAFVKNCLCSVYRLMQQGLTAKMLCITTPRVPNDPLDIYYDYSPYVTFTSQELSEQLAIQEFQFAGCPLHWANDFALLDRLLQLQVFKTNQRNSLGDTPLITFIKRLGEEQQYLDSTTTKVSNKASNKVRYKARKTPSKPTSFRKYEPRSHANERLCWVLRLITSGGRINSKNRIGDTALHYAVVNHDIASVQMLIIFGARVNLRNNDNHSVLHIACSLLGQLQKSPVAMTASSRSPSTPRRQIFSPGSQKTSVASSTLLLAGQKDTTRFKQHFIQIIHLLMESCARKCPPKMEGCGVDCGSNRVNMSPSTQSLNSNKSMSKFQKDLFHVCINEKPHTDSDKVTDKENDSTMEAKFDQAVIRSVVQEKSDNALKKKSEMFSNEMNKSQSKSTLKEKSSSKLLSTSNSLEKTDSSTGLRRDESTLSVQSLEIESKEEESLKAKEEKTSTPVENKKPVSEIKEPGSQKQVKKEASAEKQSDAPKKRLANMIVFDGGDSVSGIRPLIQTLIINEIDNYLVHPLHEYFQVMAGVSFGGTVGAMIAVNRSPIKAFYFFLRLKENFKTPVMSNLNSNALRLEQSLQQEFSQQMRMSDVSTLYGKHLMLLTTMINREPVIQKILHSHSVQPAFAIGVTEQDPKVPLWWACRAASCGLYCYRTFEGYYDGGLHASNPTMDALAHYEACRVELDTMQLSSSSQEQQQNSEVTENPDLHPIGMVLSVGSGSRPVKEDVPIKDLANSILGYQMDIPYFTSLRNIIFESVTEQDGFVAERARVWCESVQTNYSRVNFTFNRNPGQTYLHRVTAGTLRSEPSAIVLRDDQLLQILWNVKVQMLESKHKFNRLAKCLEAQYSLQR